MITWCDLLTKLIDRKLAYRQSLRDDLQVLLQFNQSDFEPTPGLFESSSLVALEQKIKQEQAQSERLEAEIYAVAQEILQHPLCLIPLEPSDVPFYHHLEMARLSLETNDPDEAYHQCQLAAQILLSWEDKFCPSDRGLIYLFYAAVSLERGDYHDAQRLAAWAYGYLAPEGYNPERMVARLIQGHSYANNGSKTYPEGRQAYDDATQRLGKMQEVAAERGKQRRAEFCRVLKEYLKERSFQLAPARVLEHPAYLNGAAGSELIISERQNGISTEEAAVVDGIAVRPKKPSEPR